MRKTLLIALMTGSLALGAVSTYGGPIGKLDEGVARGEVLLQPDKRLEVETEKKSIVKGSKKEYLEAERETLNPDEYINQGGAKKADFPPYNAIPLG